jgi:hypothetical protein
MLDKLGPLGIVQPDNFKIPLFKNLVSLGTFTICDWGREYNRRFTLMPAHDNDNWPCLGCLIDFEDVRDGTSFTLPCSASGNTEDEMKLDLCAKFAEFSNPVVCIQSTFNMSTGIQEVYKKDSSDNFVRIGFLIQATSSDRREDRWIYVVEPS